MSQRIVTHQIKLPLSVTIILGLIAFGLIANVLKPVLKIDEAFAAGDVHKIAICDLKSQCAEMVNTRGRGGGVSLGLFNFGQ